MVSLQYFDGLTLILAQDLLKQATYTAHSGGNEFLLHAGQRYCTPAPPTELSRTA